MKRISIVLALVACAPLFAACALLEAERPAPKDPAVAPDQQYLAKKGPSTNLDVGQDQKTALETMKGLEEERAALRKRVETFEAERKDLLAKIKSLEGERDQEKSLRVTAQAERDDAKRQALDRDARLLNLAIQKTQLEQEVLLAKIANLEKDKTEKPADSGILREPAGAAPPPQSGRGIPHAGPGVDR
jgi:chromosome segregation ATPase